MQIAVGGSFIGGVGESGMGKYGGHVGFEEFSHLRPVLWSNNMYGKVLRFLRSDILVTRPGVDTVCRHLMRIPFPGSNGVPMGENFGRWFGRALKVSAAVACAVAAKAVLGK